MEEETRQCGTCGGPLTRQTEQFMEVEVEVEVDGELEGEIGYELRLVWEKHSPKECVQFLAGQVVRLEESIALIAKMLEVRR